MNKRIIILILAFVLVAGAASYLLRSKEKGIVQQRTGSSVMQSPSPSQSGQTRRGELTYSGIIRDINYGCHRDGVCAVEVGPYWVTVQKGESLHEEVRGRIVGLTLDESKKSEMVGRVANVKAIFSEPDTMTIYGNDGYFLEVTDTRPKETFEPGRACTADADCVLFVCAGSCVNTEEAKKYPPDLPCMTYQNYKCTCVNKKCIRHF